MYLPSWISPAKLDGHSTTIRSEAFPGLATLWSIHIWDGLMHVLLRGKLFVPEHSYPCLVPWASLLLPVQSILLYYHQTKTAKNEFSNLLLIRFPHPSPFVASKTTRSPMSFRPSESNPLPSPSPAGRPESSKSALKDSI